MIDNTLPTLARFSAYQERYLDKLYKHLPGFERFGTVVQCFLRDIIKRGEFYLRVPVKVLPLVLESGEIKNVLQCEKRPDMGNGQNRVQAVHAMFDCDTASLKPEDYPRFGYLSDPNPNSNIFISGEMGYQYGDVVFRLRKDCLMTRTTLTFGDSLNFGRCFGMVPTAVTEVQPTCIWGLPNGHGTPLQSLPDPGLLWRYIASKIMNNTLTVKNFAMINNLTDELPYFEFFELQFHGGLKVPEDISGIDVYLSDYKEYSEIMQGAEEYCRAHSLDFGTHQM